ncbi:hypothetical protein EQV77_06185 [Halobacillus fulvus]|nr:hypothetical protein EQV77_06185 [Halobacillus fulvus]
MSREIKLDRNEVEDSLTNMQAAIQSLSLPAMKTMGEQSNLEMLKQLNELNTELKLLVENYQHLLLNNESATRRSVESLSQSDQVAARFMTK